MTTVKMPLMQSQVNYTESCNIKKGVSWRADYGLQQDAAALKISSEGRKKAGEYVNIAKLKKEQEAYDDEATVDQAKTQKSFGHLLDAAIGGDALSKEELERLDTELFTRIQRHYSDMQNLRLPEDDKRVLEALKKNYLMKQQALKDMNKAAADAALEAETAQQEAKDAQNAGEVANKAAEADMIAKSLEEPDQKTDTGTRKNEEIAGGTMSGTAQDNTVSDADKAANHQKVMNYDRNNQRNIEEIDSQQITEAMQEKEYSKMLDESYERTMQVFENKGFTLKERVEAYQIFIDEAEELAVNRELAKHLKLYDHESVTDLRLKALSGQGLKNATVRTDIDAVQNSGRNFVKNAAADQFQALKYHKKQNKEISKSKPVTDDHENKDQSKP